MINKATSKANNKNGSNTIPHANLLYPFLHKLSKMIAQNTTYRTFAANINKLLKFNLHEKRPTQYLCGSATFCINIAIIATAEIKTYTCDGEHNKL